MDEKFNKENYFKSEKEILEKYCEDSRIEEKEQNILKLFFGFKGVSKMTLSEIAEKYNITTELVRQIKEKAKAKVRQIANQDNENSM